MAQNRRRKGRKPARQSQTNRLIGWLVSYAMDDQGKAFEIRAGRTLISSEEHGNRSIALEAEDISTPHLAMSASPKHRILVQDIFSDTGSFVQRAGAKQEDSVEGPIELEHGDWLRLGDNTRFQLCLIDAPTRT